MKVTFRLKASELLCVYFIFTAYTQIRLHCTQRTSFVFIEKDVLGLGVGMLFFTGHFLSGGKTQKKSFQLRSCLIFN